MTRLLHVAGLATTLISHSPAAADTRHTCGAGVRAVQRVSETTIRETAASGPEATGGPVVVDHGAERHQRRVLVTVQLGLMAMGVVDTMMVGRVSPVALAMPTSEKGSGGKHPLGMVLALIFGAALWPIGQVGSLFATLIHLAVNRQREFLAERRDHLPVERHVHAIDGLACG